MTETQKLKAAKAALLTMQRHPWEQGTAAQAFLEAGDERTALLLAHEAVARQSADGRLGWMYSLRNITDPCVCGEPVLWAWRKTGDGRYLTAARRMFAYIDGAPGSADRIQYHNEAEPMIAADCMYMVPPFYAAMGRFDEAVRQVDRRFTLLWNAEKRAMNHQWDDGHGCLWRDKRWGAATGWNAAGIVRVLHALPADRTEDRARLAGYLEALVSGILQYQLPGGLFYDVLDEGETSFVETNCAQMMAYSIYRGITWGFLDRKYLPAAERMREGANAMVDDLGLVQGASAAPTFDVTGVSPEAQAFYILMETARAQCPEMK